MGRLKVVVTGANGMLGADLFSTLEGYDLYPCARVDLDILNRSDVDKKIQSISPDVIIHAAAYTNVEESEGEKDKAYLINTIGTQNLVNCCVGKATLFVYISSTGIYGDHGDGPYNEFDEVKPTTIHHKSKYEAEKIVEKHLSRFLILRTGWLYGGDRYQNKNFVYKRYLEALEKETVYSNGDQLGNPTSTISFAKQIQVLIDEKLYGVFNCVNEAYKTSRFDYVSKIIELFGVETKVYKLPGGGYKRTAPVSNNESAVNYKLNLLGLNVMGGWEECLSDYVLRLKDQL